MLFLQGSSKVISMLDPLKNTAVKLQQTICYYDLKCGWLLCCWEVVRKSFDKASLLYQRTSSIVDKCFSEAVDRAVDKSPRYQMWQ